MITCRELIDFLMEYLDQELPAERRAEFESHLAHCGPCRCYLDSYREAVRLGKAVLCPTSEPVPPSVPEDLVKAVLAARHKTK